MNERIRELIERATEPPVFPANIGYFNREKFAELLIRECISMADEFEMNVNRSGLVDRMKEHFGVKE